MQTQHIPTSQSTGRIHRTICGADGKKLRANGHTISDEDIRMLEIEEMYEVWVTKLEEGEMSEDHAVMMVTTENGIMTLPVGASVRSISVGVSVS
jgi:hypothetical protein